MGTATSEDGQRLAGARVTVESEALLGGSLVTGTGANGVFTFAALPPGIYRLKVELEGFSTQEIEGLAVLLDRTNSIAVQLALGDVSETVEVVAGATALDTRRVAATDNFEADYLRQAPVGIGNLDFQSIVAHAGGVASQSIDQSDPFGVNGVGGGSNPQIFGSIASENVYHVDGIDTTDPVTGTFGLLVNYDAIQEVSLLKGGFEPEYGLAAGGVINLITKSGGNSFGGTIDLRYFDDSFASDGDFYDSRERLPGSERVSLTLGGPVAKDRLWFFVSGERRKFESVPLGGVTSGSFEGDNYIGKLTWHPGSTWTLLGKIFTDPADIHSALFDVGAVGATQQQGGTIWQVNASGVPTPALLVDLSLGVQRNELDTAGSNRGVGTPGRFDFATGVTSGNLQFWNLGDREFDQLRGSVSPLLGTHEFKFGVGYNERTFEQRVAPTGRGFFFRDNVPFAGVPIRVLDLSTDQGVQRDEGTITSLFAQDAWAATPRLTVRYGARWDQIQYDNDAGSRVVDFDELQPRVGVAWQVTENADTMVRVSWGRFTDSTAFVLPLTASQRSTLTDQYVSCSDLAAAFPALADPAACSASVAAFTGASGDLVSDPFGEESVAWALAAPAFDFTPNQIAPGLDSTTSEQIIAAFERRLGKRSTLEVSFVDKETTGILEDTCAVNLGFAPDCSFFVVDNLARLRRDYQAATLTLRSRAADRVNLQASYTYSESEGNIEGTQHQGPDFDNIPGVGNGTLNRFGRLSDDRTHRAKINGYVLLPIDFTLGFSAFYSSDFGWTPVGTDLEFSERRGAREGNANYQLDLQITKGFRLGERGRIEIFGSLLNVLDSEKTTSYCPFADGCVRGADQIDFADPLFYQTPQRFEVGVRFEI